MPRESPLHQYQQHDPFNNFLKSLLLPPDFPSSSMKSAFFLCAVASICLVSYFGFSARSRHFTTRLRNFSSVHGGPAKHNLTTKAFEEAREKTNASHIVFGIGASVKTWHARRYYCELWWRPRVTRGFIWLDHAPTGNESWPESSPPWKVSEDTSRFRYTSWYGTRSAIRIARIVKESFELGLNDVRWFVMGDDDTVFFVENLVNLLGRYDHREMYYIGGNSESVEQDVVHSYGMAYGGGGVAISKPLAAVLVKVLDGCIDRYHSFYGSDQKIQACMDEIGVPLTRELGFHQMDIKGDPYGILAAHPTSTPLISLHHLDYLRPIFPGLSRTESIKKLVQAHEPDPGRILQHSFCHDPRRNMTVYVAWGYTAQIYPWFETAKALETPIQTFVTWKDVAKPIFTFNTRAPPADPCKRPVVFMLGRVERRWKAGRMFTVSTYGRVRKDVGMDSCRWEDYAAALRVQYVVVSAPKMSAAHWDKAPRRQCCEILKGGHEQERVIRVEIRYCRPHETLAPPR